MRLFKRRISLVALSVMVIPLLLLGGTAANANHGGLHNATEQHSGNWYGSGATIEYTNPNLRTGSNNFVYHRTSTNHQNPGTCFRFSEIGWIKDTNSTYGLVVWDNGCNRQTRTFSISPATYRYHQQYWDDNGVDKYCWGVDGSNFDCGVSNFSYSTTVTEGGEVSSCGCEAMGNTLAYDNQRVVENGGSYFYVLWGGHTNYVDNAPYTNVDTTWDPDNAFYSKGNE